MNNHLRVISKPLLIDIQDYQQGHAIIQNCRLIDSYEKPINHGHGRYRLIIESSIIRDEKDLSKAIETTRRIADQVTLLLKCVLGESMNTPVDSIDSFTKVLVRYGEMPLGWESNYLSVKVELDRGKRYRSTLEVIPEHFFELNKSPFDEIVTAMKAYPKMDIAIKDLLVIINEVDLLSVSSRYVLIGKALEIVDSIYPLNHQRNDNRIIQHFPELVECFKCMTIKSLMNLSNNRKETRHYYDKKANATHPGMTDDEMKAYYEYSNLLCINVIRKSLGLECCTIEKV